MKKWGDSWPASSAWGLLALREGRGCSLWNSRHSGTLLSPFTSPDSRVSSQRPLSLPIRASHPWKLSSSFPTPNLAKNGSLSFSFLYRLKVSCNHCSHRFAFCREDPESNNFLSPWSFKVIWNHICRWSYCLQKSSFFPLFIPHIDFNIIIVLVCHNIPGTE